MPHSLFTMRRRLGLLLAAALGCAAPALAHHSFAVFFDEARLTSMRGTVVEFHFRNPHGIILLRVVDANGTARNWKAETNSPSILVRRGWSKASLKAGDEIQVEGWLARNGSPYLRMRSVKRADGSAVGVPFESVEQQQ